MERPRFAPASPRVQKDDSGALRPDPRFYSASAMGSVGRDGRVRAPLLFYLFKTAVWGRRRSDVARTPPVRSFPPAALPERKDGARGVPGAPRVKTATLAVQTGSTRGAPENRSGKELKTENASTFSRKNSDASTGIFEYASTGISKIQNRASIAHLYPTSASKMC